MTALAPEGLLLIDKPSGALSFSLIRRARRCLGVQKIGHTGTLDPFASGLIILLVGRNYTKKSDELLAYEKDYIAQYTLGSSSDTYDRDGVISPVSSHIPSLQDIQNALEKLNGKLPQVPPMYSAKKVEGKRLYDLARKGVVIERAPCMVEVCARLLSYDYPHVDIALTSSKGFYVRSHAFDLGTLLSCGAYVNQLRRTRCGAYSVQNAVEASVLDGDAAYVTSILYP